MDVLVLDKTSIRVFGGTYMMIGKIRYTQRSCTDMQVIDEFLNKTRVGVVGMQSGKYPYTVPVNYVWYKGAVYFHGMGSGKKNELLEGKQPVSFTVFEEYGTVKDPVACNADTSYRSVMIFGYALKVEDVKESAEVLNCIVEKYMPDFYKSKITPGLAKNYRSSHDNKAVAVFKIVPEELTAKENIAEPGDIFGKPEM
jgi:uncharacterized protein